MSLSTQPYKGARDFYPEDMRVRNAIFDVWRQVALSFGYEEYDAPILEPVDLFAAKSGDELVNEQSYNFTDRGGREIMLRPEMTPSVARLVAGRRQELPLPIRWFSIPSCWRYERPQKGRGREFYQLNIDMFGVDSSMAEVEMLQMVDAIMRGHGAKREMYEIKVNSRVLLNKLLGEYLGLDEVEQKTVTRLIDKMHKIEGPEFIGLIETAIAPSKREAGVADRLVAILKGEKGVELPTELFESDSFKNLRSVLDVTDKLGLSNIVFDITLVRGLDYYTDFVFEVFDNSPDNNRSLFGGGRYDGLVGLFGAEQIPTIGFAVSDVTMREFLTGHDLLPSVNAELELVILPIGDVVVSALQVASELREMGVKVALDSTQRKTDKMIKTAVKSGAPYVLFVGQEEVESQQYKLKNLATGEEEVHSIQRIVSIIKDRRKTPLIV